MASSQRRCLRLEVTEPGEVIVITGVEPDQLFTCASPESFADS
jgi:hypothetical protein